MTEWNGYPENPERDGWHWVVAADPAVSTESAPWWWSSSNQHWLPPCDVSGALPLTPSRVQWRYIGPCLTPAEVAAREQAAYKEGWSDREDDLLAGHQRIGTLDTMLAQARREGMEAAGKEWTAVIRSEFEKEPSE